MRVRACECEDRWLEIKSHRQEEKNVTPVALTSFHRRHYTPSITISSKAPDD